MNLSTVALGFGYPPPPSPSVALTSGGFELLGLSDPARELHYSYAACGLTCDFHGAPQEVTLRQVGLPIWALVLLACALLAGGGAVGWRLVRREQRRVRALESGRLRYTENGASAVAVALPDGVKYHLCPLPRCRTLVFIARSERPAFASLVRQF